MLREPEFTIGIEEEYLLVDRVSRDLASEPPDSMMAECEDSLRGQVAPEFMRAQIEVGTRVYRRVRDAGADLMRLRGTVAEIARRHGLAPIAASTHPFARWEDQHQVHKERYDVLARDMQGAVRRLLICGMHVHVGIADNELRIDLMNQAAYFLPHLLTLSTSSPFWRAQNTGLKSYRLTVFDAMPRTGIPDRFDSYGEYQRMVSHLVGAGVIEDATKIWTDVRLSARFPTLEMRITDVCTRLNDAICIAALYQCVLSMLYRLRLNNQRWRIYPRILVHENRWRAQRYGIDGELIDLGKGSLVPFAELLDEILGLVEEDAQRLECLSEVQNARRILTRGTSADRQLARYKEVRDGGADHDDALRAVVDLLIDDTVDGVKLP